MNDMELADEIERHISNRPSGFVIPPYPLYEANAKQIIAALRRGPEPSVPCPLCKGAGQRDVPSFVDPSKTVKNSCSVCKGKGVITSERPPSGEMAMVPREPTKAIIMAMNETYWKLAERPKLTQGGNVYVDEYAATIYRAMLSAAEAEGRKG